MPATRLYASIFLVVLTAVAIVSPVLVTPLSGDDAFNSYLDGWKLAHHASLLSTFNVEFHEWDIGRGRFAPILQVINVLQFHFIHETLVLKILQVTAIAVDVVLIFAAVLEISGSAQAAAGSSIIAVLTLQGRSWYDAMAQYNLHLPTATAFGLAALLFLSRAARRHSRADYLASLTFFALATLTYEIFAPLIVPLVYMLLRSSNRFTLRLKRALPFIGVVVIQGAAVAAIRHFLPQAVGSAYAPEVFSGRYLPTTWWQLVGALPLDYILVDPQAIFRNHPGWWHVTNALSLVTMLLGAATAASALSLPTFGSERDQVASVLVVAGLTMALAPALMVAASPFYQTAVMPGLPYIPVYAQGFGIALLCAPLGTRVFARRGPLLVRALIVIAVAFACVTLRSANALALQGLTSWGFPRDTIVDGLAHGAGASVARDAIVFLDNSYIVNERFEKNSLWNNVWFYRLYAGQTWRTRPLADEAKIGTNEASELRSIGNSAKHGALIIERVKRGADGNLFLLGARIAERASGRRGRPLFVGSAFTRRAFDVEARGTNWEVYRFTPHCSRLPTTALIDNSPSLVSSSFGAGFFETEHDGEQTFRWAGPVAHLVLRTSSTAPVHVILTASVATVGNARGFFEVTRPGATFARIAISSKPASLKLLATVSQKSTNTLLFRTFAPDVALPGDKRDLRLKISSVIAADRSGCAAADGLGR